ncbi:hypothetical protein BFX40_02665 [Mesorhizobium sp. SEMIA 3007]|uniref:hypothetical protein n=1 Tax=Mesorhizobium TaxID=68287 RepID=UPI000499F2BB|nr:MULTISPECIES: hypothetical protein [Mesorhizobium]AID30444.1 hypothetical protein MCHK_2634 [Mesorhizobium huakuii 7653R]MCH4559632.1 hypothetical protein [Mesorhizobium jarvisii]ODA91896.1 hypothetical protein BFX40_02665 [Mesorhizobium sp. SEMIA 3007]BCG73395.1 hypothetical protein MesoLj113a_45530 [Mesorhizobium sp. 113-1-2]
MASSEAEFVHRENIKHFEKRLETETDPATRKLLLKLLDEEKAKLLNITNHPPYKRSIRSAEGYHR